MSEIVKRLRERRANVWEQAKELADRAADENRAFSAEEQGQWDAQNEELNTLDTRIKSALDTEQRAKDADEAFERLGRSGGGEVRRGEGAASPIADKELDEQFRKLGSGELRTVSVGLPTAFERRSIVESRGAVESRVLDTGVPPMPTTFIRQLYQYLVDTSSIRMANPRVITTASGEQLTLPVATADGAASWTAEKAQIAESDPAFDSVTLGAYKVANLISVSAELIADAGFDLLGFLAEQAGRSVGVATNVAYVAGTGSTRPTGFLNSSLTATTLGAHAVGGDDLIDLFHSVPPMYRANASWLLNDAILAEVRKLREDTGGAGTGNYLWQPGLQVGEPDRILGRPVYANPAMPDDLAATSSKVVAFGDFAGYWVRDVTPLRFDRSDDFKFDTDVVSFRVIYRTDGAVGDPNAIRLLNTPAT